MEDAKVARQTKPIHRGDKQPASAKVNQDLYEQLSKSGESNIVEEFNIDRKSAKAWILKAGQLCRITLKEGTQIGGWNFWNLHNREEKLYSGKTRQIHAAHLSVYDRLWSSFPHLRPLATITADSLSWYGIDEDGGGVHDIMGTPCDPYTYKLITGEETFDSCHQYLTEAIKPYGLNEADVHDVFDVFMCSGITADKHEYFVRGSPAQVGDFIEVFAEIDLLTALSACPQGDCLRQWGEKMPDKACYPLNVTIRQPDSELLTKWKKEKDLTATSQ